VLAPATIQDSSVTESIEGSNSWLVPGLLVAAATLILLWVGFSEFRRRMTLSVYRSPAPASGPSFDALEPETAVEKMAAPKRIAGGPPQISLHLKASEPSVRRAAVPFGKTSRPFSPNGGSVTTVGAAVENLIPRSPVVAPAPERIETPVIEPLAEIMPSAKTAPEVDQDRDLTPASITEVAEFSSVGEPQAIEKPAEIIESLAEIPAAVQEAPVTEETFVAEETLRAEEAPAVEEAPAIEETPVWSAPAMPEPAWTPVSFEPPAPVFEAPAPVFETPAPVFEIPAPAAEIAEPAVETEAFVESVSEPVFIEPETLSAPEIVPAPVMEQAAEISGPDIEPVAQGQPIPYQVPAFETDSAMAEITKPEPESPPVPASPIAGVGALRHSVESPSFAPQVISTEPLAQQPTTPATMPQLNQPTPAPAIRPAPMSGGGAPQPQPSSGMQTAVQLTFSFEIASLQLTPSFKMGALQLKPTSKIVTMRLAPSQQPQPAMNLQVTFEIATVQAAGGGIGQIRLTPSQQQRPSVISSPAFNIAGLQLLSGSDAGAVQLTPSQQGQASVHVTGKFQIATVEFSPSFEIASLVLNSTSKSVSVQLPGAGPSAVEGAPVFEIANVQITGNGEIGMMQLNAQGAAPKAA
jgi:hypothetical protein